MVHGDSCMSASHNAASQLRHDESRYVTVTICLMLSRWDGTVRHEMRHDCVRCVPMCRDVRMSHNAGMCVPIHDIYNGEDAHAQIMPSFGRQHLWVGCVCDL